MTDKTTDVIVTQADRLLVDRFDHLEWLSEDGRQNPAALDLAARHRTASEQSASGAVKVLREALAGLVAQRFDYPGPVEGAMHLWEEARNALLITSEAPAQEDQQ